MKIKDNMPCLFTFNYLLANTGFQNWISSLKKLRIKKCLGEFTNFNNFNSSNIKIVHGNLRQFGKGEENFRSLVFNNWINPV